MTKEQIEISKKIVGIFNKANFNISAAEMLVFSRSFEAFGKMIIDAERALEIENSFPKSSKKAK